MTRNQSYWLFEARWGELSQYNAECARGLMHTPEWDARMKLKQAQYDKMTADGLDLCIDPIPEVTVP